MSADDQAFLDVLNSVGSDVKKFSGDVAGYIERHVEDAAASLRGTLSSQSWLPDQVRPKPPPRPPVAAQIVSPSLYNRVNGWVLRNKLLTGTFVLGLTATAVHLVHRKRRAYGRKRRAKRASNGARLEVVVLAGSPSEPIVRSLALDLERRGFIVFIICNDVEEEILVQNEARADIKPLSIDISQPNHSIERLTAYLQTPQHAFEGARPHHLIFSSLILIPSLSFPAAPLATIPSSSISDIINTRLVHPILLTQAFLPLLTALPFTLPHNHQQLTPSDPSILVLTSTIIPSLNPPFHIPESVSTSALATFVQALTVELSPLSIPVTHLKLGNFDITSLQARNPSQSLQTLRAETLSWPQGARQIYGGNYLRMMERGSGSGGRGGSSLRELHNAVFDAMETRSRWSWRPSRGKVVNVGRGSGMYGFVGAWLPKGLVSWMMGMQSVNRTVVVEREEESDLIGSGEFISIYDKDGNDQDHGRRYD
ncbi:MAG: hypothetical protein M1818_007984 [Claussenomyces sp. TS43310]|nr:MAG: hypothetical protein M1818_007984 [Claussenomyces sp. TS43310]